MTVPYLLRFCPFYYICIRKEEGGNLLQFIKNC